MSFILCSSGAIVIKAGAKVSATAAASSAILSQFSDEAEGQINATTRFNWVDAYATLNADVQGILKETSANLAAMNLIAYDMSGYTSRGEANDMIDLLRDIALRNLKNLEEVKHRAFMEAA